MRIPPRIARVSALSALAATLVFGGGAVANASVGAFDEAPSSAPASSAPAVVSPADVGKVCYDKLPKEAHETLDLIEKGGPYPYPQDGTVFDNREGLLPDQDSGYYHEFTVETPGSDDRGAKRIVTGEKDKEDYYTEDHYESFDLVDYDC